MIKDNIKYAAYYPEFVEILAELAKVDEDTPNGKIDINENTWINVSEVESAQGEDYLFEAHREYLDIHYVVCGEEKLMYAGIDGLHTVNEYSAERDCEALKGDGEIITLKQGDFCIVFPQDAHVPFFGKSDFLKKAVVKMKIGK